MKRLACARARALIPFYLEHEVEPAQALEVAAHLASCRVCAEEASAERQIMDALRSLPAPPPDGDVASGVVSTLRRIRASLPRPRALKWSAVGLLAALLLLDGLRPGSPTRHGIRFLTNLGELIDLDAVVGRLMDLLPNLLPATTSLPALLGAGTAAAPVALHPAAIGAGVLIVGGLLLMLLSGLILLGGLAARALRTRLISLF